ncbi:MAG TPA: oxygenase MpaB family protein [Bryobacteraceae bacterium]
MSNEMVKARAQVGDNGGMEKSARRPYADAAATYRRAVMFDLAEEFEIGFFLSYYRNFSIPHIAQVLALTGEVHARPSKRSMDTAIVMYELIEDGFDGARGQAMVDLLNRVHKGIRGTNEDFLYVLTTLLVVPIRFCDAHGRRGTTDEERQAATDFYAELAQRMRIDHAFMSYESAERFLNDYEEQFSAPSDAGAELMSSTMSLFRDRLPGPLAPLAAHVLSVLFDDSRLSRSLGLPVPNLVIRTAVHFGLRVRAAQLRRRPPRGQSRFNPGKAGSGVYPDGYSIDELGPQRRAH